MKQKGTPRRTHRSRGEIISTVTFILVGVFFAGEANLLWEQNDRLYASLMTLCAALCVAAGLRFHIHNIWHQIKDLFK